MIRYFKNPLTNEIYGYDDDFDHQVEHMNQRIIDENLIEITDSFVPEDPPAPVPESITRPQCAVQLFRMGFITGDEAVAMAQNATPPAYILTQFESFTAEDKVYALIAFARYTYERNHPLLEQVLAANGYSSSDVDQFFRQASLA